MRGERLAARWLGRTSALLLAAAVGLAAGGAPESPDALMATLAAELSRAMDLRVESLEKPYFIAYRLSDGETFELEATLGEIVAASEPTRVRWFGPDVRVGSWERDSGEFFGRRSFFSALAGLGRPAALDDDGAALRHDVWLATDEAYKGAVEHLSQKRAALKNRVEEEAAPDFTKEPAVSALLPARATTLDFVKWRETVRRVSAVFRGFPAIQESSVRLRASAGRKYVVDSEGTRLRQPAGMATLIIRAAAQAGDGAPLKEVAAFAEPRLEDLPAESELSAAARRVAEKLTALTTAPTVESYTGPVLFTGQASAELFAQVLAPQLSGHRPPVFETEQMGSAMAKNDLADKLDRPILPPFLSVVDDPTQESVGGLPLFGHYAFDDEGVRAVPVTLVQNGVLKTLLMSRRPRKEIARSNGHGRALLPGTAGAVIGNLFVKAAEGKAVADPKAELIRLSREAGLKFGILVRVLDQPGGPGGGLSAMFSAAGRQGRSSIGAPLEAYRVFVEDGREELVRGLVPAEFTLRTLKDIAAAGTDTYVYNRLAPGGGLLGAFGGADEGTGLPVSIVVPPVLEREMEFAREAGSRQKPPLLPSPLAAGKPAAH
ncbi:MAG TPA: metallopeptidase TldD-related protein [Thermoanaerobaculia bacterium]|nr:metallopeptidase TldD-related protein [Thermoanaerobaculia bacterium]